MSAERATPYNKLPTEHELVEHYRPRFLARGGDHLVYEAEGHPDSVIKASTYKIKDILVANAERGIPLTELSPEMRSALENELEEKNAQIRGYREYFGTEHTLAERRYLMQVPISSEIAREIFIGDWKHRQLPAGLDQINEVWTTVVIQKKAPEISDPRHLGLYFGGFLEERKEQPTEAEYSALNEAFLGKHSITPEDLNLFFKTQDNPKTHALADLVAKAAGDPALKVAVENFVRQTIDFADETGNILALAGEDNVVLSPREGGWEYLLVDAVPLLNEPIFKLAKEARLRLKKGEVISPQEEVFIARASNFVRTINGLAAALGIEQKLEL